MHRMIEQGVSAVMVEPDASGQWGIMTDLDVLKKVISTSRSPARVKVGDIANRPLVTVKRDLSLAEASRQMAAVNVRRVIVEMDGKPVGMVTDHDLFRTVEVFGWGPDA
jgi:isocitrate dehydrogenase